MKHLNGNHFSTCYCTVAFSQWKSYARHSNHSFVFDRTCQKIDEGNWGKLKRVLKYLEGASNLELILTCDQVALITWYVDESFAMHGDCKGHTSEMLNDRLIFNWF